MDTKQSKVPPYLWEKTYATLNILATSNGDLRARIVSAWTSQFLRLKLPISSLPDGFSERYEALYAKVTAHPGETADEGSIAASVRRMGELEVNELAEEMFSFCLDAQRADAKHS